MGKPKEEEKLIIPKRQVGKKTKHDTFANLRKPHPVEEFLGLVRPVTETSLAKANEQAVSQTRLASQPSLAVESQPQIDLMESLPDVKGYMKLYFQMVDYLYPQLDPFERAVHETLYRLSWGFKRPTCTISYRRLAERTNMSMRSAQRAADKLVSKGLVRKSRFIIGNKKEQGIEWWVVPVPRQVAEASLVGEPSLDRQATMKDTNTQKDINTQTSVSAKSRFSLDQCRQYAESLRSQGIKNPGGYAVTIYRSGEADEQITAMLNRCPTCNGKRRVYNDLSGYFDLPCPDCA